MRSLRTAENREPHEHGMSTDNQSSPPPSGTAPELPTREELQRELLEIPDEPQAPPSSPEQVSLEAVLATAVRYVRAKRGGDLMALILVGSGARRALTPHSDVDLIAVVKGPDEGEETVRIGDRMIEVRYRAQKNMEQDLVHAPRLPPLLRKGRILFELEAAGVRLVDKANQRFRQGPPPANVHEKIRLKADCLHWLGKAEDLRHNPAVAQHLLGLFFEDVLQAFFRLRGFWLTAPAEMLRFVSTRDPAVGEAAERFLTAPALTDRLAAGRQLAGLVFQDVPNPQRID